MKKVMLTLAALAVATGAHAGVNLVQNGSFETTSPAGTGGQVNFSGYSLTDWSAPALSHSYDFVFIPGAGTSGTTADTTGSLGQHGAVKFWGPGDGSANGLDLSPDGGNFFASDPKYQNGGPLTQTITGLVVGQKYTLSFDWAGAQQFGKKGATTEGWDFSLGGSSGTTGTVADANHGFTGWQTESETFTATSTSEVLSFLAIGSPNASAPPFALLDGVSLTSAGVPEPATWAMMLIGFAGLGSVLRSRRKQAPSLA